MVIAGLGGVTRSIWMWKSAGLVRLSDHRGGSCRLARVRQLETPEQADRQLRDRHAWIPLVHRTGGVVHLDQDQWL